jgi:hypothetical protein
LLEPRPTSKLEDHPSSAVRDCLFNLFAVARRIGGRSSIRNLRTRQALVTGTHLHGESILQSYILSLNGGNNFCGVDDREQDERDFLTSQ